MVRVDLQGYDDALGKFDRKPVQQAARSALKKVAASARTVASEEIRNIYNVKKSDLDPRITIAPPRGDNLTAEIDISGKGLSLSFFGARQTTGNRVITRTKGGLKSRTLKRSAKFQGVAVEVEKGKSTQLKSAFLATMKSGHIGVLHRVGKKRLPIREKSVISLASMIQNAKVAPIVLSKVDERWGIVFPQELSYFLEKGK